MLKPAYYLINENHRTLISLAKENNLDERFFIRKFDNTLSMAEGFYFPAYETSKELEKKLEKHFPEKLYCEEISKEDFMVLVLNRNLKS